MMRINKWLAQNGVASRRTIEDWIKAGKIMVNGQKAVLGLQVSPRCRITIDGKPIMCQESDLDDVRLIMFNKPEGVICSRNGEGKPTAFEYLPPLSSGRWVMVGRLDINSSGLLLFTNHGELANHLMHPRNEFERQYLVRVLGKLTLNDIAQLKRGVELDEGIAKFKHIEPLQGKSGLNQWYKVTLTEGKYREVRRLFETVNCTVSRLTRVRYGDFALPRSLKQGMIEEIKTTRVQGLLSQLGCH